MEVEKLISVSSTDDHEKDDHEEDDDQAAVLPGFRFHPTDQELVEFYLRRKVEKRPAKIDLIKPVDVYKNEPWDLPKLVNRVGEREWYFFCRRGRKYKNSIRPNRVTGSGFWKATGIDKPIYSLGEEQEEAEEEKDCVGLKKSLVYYRGSAGKGTKTDWMMHEFRLPPATKTSDVNTAQEAEVWTLCRIFQREASHRRCTPDWRRKFSPEQSYCNSSSKASYSESEIRNKHRFSGIEKKPAANDSLCNGNRYQLNLTTTQVPFMASHPSFAASPNGVVENFVGGNWDELRPMVEFAPDQSAVYGLR